MVPRVAAVRVETRWETRRPVMHCVARLTRALSRRERDEMSRFPEFRVGDDGVTYSCRPEETEAAEKRLSSALRVVADSPDKPGKPRLTAVPPR